MSEIELVISWNAGVENGWHRISSKLYRTEAKLVEENVIEYMDYNIRFNDGLLHIDIDSSIQLQELPLKPLVDFFLERKLIQQI